jgi:hypothetical protein
MFKVLREIKKKTCKNNPTVYTDNNYGTVGQ